MSKVNIQIEIPEELVATEREQKLLERIQKHAIEQAVLELYAQTRQLPIIGTVGILLVAKNNSLITNIKQPLHALVAAGIRINPLLYSQALLAAGE